MKREKPGRRAPHWQRGQSRAGGCKDHIIRAVNVVSFPVGVRALLALSCVWSGGCRELSMLGTQSFSQGYELEKSAYTHPPLGSPLVGELQTPSDASG